MNNMKKTYKKSSKPRQHVTQKRKYAIILIVCILGAMVIFGLYRWYEHERMLAQEAETYASLRQDMKNLHQEFNKIDPGWVYHEGCQGMGEVYKRNVPGTCSIELEYKNDAVRNVRVYADIVNSKQDFHNLRSAEYSLNSEVDRMYKGFGVGYKNLGCSFAVYRGLAGDLPRPKFHCSGESRGFYYARDDI